MLRSLGEGIILILYGYNSVGLFSAKIVVYLAPPKPGKSDGPAAVKKADFVKLSFRKGGKDEVSFKELESVFILKI